MLLTRTARRLRVDDHPAGVGAGQKVLERLRGVVEGARGAVRRVGRQAGAGDLGGGTASHLRGEGDRDGRQWRVAEANRLTDVRRVGAGRPVGDGATTKSVNVDNR